MAARTRQEILIDGIKEMYVRDEFDVDLDDLERYAEHVFRLDGGHEVARSRREALAWLERRVEERVEGGDSE